MIDEKNVKAIKFYPLDDVAGFSQLKSVVINGREHGLNEAEKHFKFMPKTKGSYIFLLKEPRSGKLTVECTWEYRKVFEYLNNN